MKKVNLKKALLEYNANDAILDAEASKWPEDSMEYDDILANGRASEYYEDEEPEIIPRVGDTIRIIEMDDDNGKDAVAAKMTGKVGTIEHIDGRGQLHGTWGSLAVIPEVDKFEIL